jgi:hypothetical protein
MDERSTNAPDSPTTHKENSMKALRRTAIAVVTAATALTLVACSSSSDETATAETSVAASEAPADEMTEETSAGTIVDVASNTEGFSTLVAAVGAAGLAETLSGEGPFTVFAPTDDAFAALPAGVRDALLLPENKDKTFQDYLDARPAAALATFVSTITAVGLMTAGAHVTQQVLTDMGDTAGRSKTIQRTPELAAEVLGHIAQGTGRESVYVDPDVFTTYFQSQGLDPVQVARDVTGSETEYADAIATSMSLASWRLRASLRGRGPTRRLPGLPRQGARRPLGSTVAVLLAPC